MTRDEIEDLLEDLEIALEMENDAVHCSDEYSVDGACDAVQSIEESIEFYKNLLSKNH